MRFLRTCSLGSLLLISACATSGGPVPEQCALDSPAANAQEHFETMVHDYLTAHPEVLMEMSQALRAKQMAAQQERAKAAIAQHRAEVFSDATDPAVGAAAGSGTVTVVEWFDSQCPWCKRLAPDLERLVAENKNVRLVYKEFPILGPGSETAAKAALASLRQGKYEAFHNALMADKTPEHQLAEPRILEIAKSIGLDIRALKADMVAPDIAAKVTANMALAKTIGISATPGLLIGDRLMPGAARYQALQQAVAEARTAYP